MILRIAAIAGIGIALDMAACGDSEPERPLAPEVYGERYKALNSEVIQRMNQASYQLVLKLGTSQFTLEIADEYIEAISSTFENFGDGLDDLEPSPALKERQDQLVAATDGFLAVTADARRRSRQAESLRGNLRAIQDVQAALDEYLVGVNLYCIQAQETDARANIDCAPPPSP